MPLYVDMQTAYRSVVTLRQMTYQILVKRYFSIPSHHRWAYNVDVKWPRKGNSVHQIIKALNNSTDSNETILFRGRFKPRLESDPAGNIKIDELKHRLIFISAYGEDFLWNVETGAVE